MQLRESAFDKGAMKFIFLAGGPGTGKNYIANRLFGIDPQFTFGASGLKLVSYDRIFEHMLKKKGYPIDLNKIPPAEREAIMSDNPSSLRQQARRLMKKQLALYAKQGVGVIFDGTGQALGPYMSRKQEMEGLGYDTYMLFVDTPLKTALERNAARERKLPDELVAQIHREVKRNKAQYEQAFGDHMLTVQNDNGADFPKKLQHAINAIVTSPVKNPKGQALVAKGKKSNSTPVSHKPAAPLQSTPVQSHHSDSLLDQTVLNPLTNNHILVKSALEYPPDHPARRAADQLLKNKKAP